MSTRIARRDRGIQEHGYGWVDTEAEHLRVIRVRRAREWQLRRDLRTPWQRLVDAFAGVTAAVRFAWGNLQRMFGALDDPNDPGEYTLAAGGIV